MKFRRPRCNNCGDKIFVRKMSIRSRLPERIFGGIPSHCPNCGKSLSNEKRAQLDAFETQIYCLLFSLVIIIIITVIIVLSVS